MEGSAHTSPWFRDAALAGSRLSSTSELVRSSLSHPEDAEAVGALDRGVLDHGEADAEHGPGVTWVDDPVVVHHPGQEERQALLLDGLLDVGPHLRVALLVVGLALRLRGGPRH